MPSGSIHAVTKDRIPFFLWRYIYSYINDIHQSIYIYSYINDIYQSLSLYIYIHISMDICLFPCFGYLNNVAMNTGVHSSLRDSDFTSSVYTFRGGIAGSYGRSISNFLRTCHTVPIYIPTNGAQSSLNSVSSPTHVSLFLYQSLFSFFILFYFIFAF